MNTLSLFLYFAEVLPSFAKLLFVFGSVAVFLLGGYILFSALNMDTYGWTTEEEKKEKRERRDYALHEAPWRVLPFAVGLMVASVFIPSKQTIYLIAGSEAGEAVVTSEEGKEIIDDIRKIIKRQLKEMTGEEVVL